MNYPGSVATADLELSRQFANRLAENLESRRFRVILFGSRARGKGDEESDLDLFIELEGDDLRGEIREVARRIACELTLEHGVLVSVFVADREFLEKHRDFAFVKTVHREGVVV
jgi:predicted nucleotidyltransferase